MGTPTEIAIRRADTGDAVEIAALLAEAFAEYRSLYTDAGYAATVIANSQVSARIKEGPVWVATRDASVIGTVSVLPKDKSLYLRGMAVLPSARGQRIGEMLLRCVEEFAASRGFSRLQLSTTPFLNRAIRLYQACGFRRTDEPPHELFGTPLFSMEKFLRSDARAQSPQA
jgi:N-acetylglutamate synthase-like GNAT family acetyltransferase